MDSAKAEAENIAPSAGKELLDKYWQEAKQEIEDINIVSRKIKNFPEKTKILFFDFRSIFGQRICR